MRFVDLSKTNSDPKMEIAAKKTRRDAVLGHDIPQFTDIVLNTCTVCELPVEPNRSGRSMCCDAMVRLQGWAKR